MKTIADAAIVGAGIAGLAAARRLQQQGLQVVLCEKSRGVGGRVATSRVEGCLADHGAQNIKPANSALEQMMLQELDTTDLLKIEQPVLLYAENGALLPPDPDHEAQPRYTYGRGIVSLPKLAAAQLSPAHTTLQLQTRIHRLKDAHESVQLLTDTGEVAADARVVILTAPLPQTAVLLAESIPLLNTPALPLLDRVRILRTVEYTQCLSVMLGYYTAPAAPAYALLAENRSADLLWLAFEHVKSPLRAPGLQALLIAQMGHRFSQYCYEEEDAMIAGRTLAEIEKLFGTAFSQPAWVQVKKWRYAQPVGKADFMQANDSEIAPRILVAGDGLRPERGRIHQAWQSGLDAAEEALKRL